MVISFAVPGSALYRVGIAFCQMQSSGNSMEEGVSQPGFKRAVAFRLPERRRVMFQVSVEDEQSGKGLG